MTSLIKQLLCINFPEESESLWAGCGMYSIACIAWKMYAISIPYTSKLDKD